MRASILAAATAGVFAVSATPAAASQVYAGQPSGASPFQFVMTLNNAGTETTGFTFHFDVACTRDYRSVDFGSALIVDDVPGSVTFGKHYLVGGKVKRGKLSSTFLGVDQVGDSVAESMSATLTGTVKPGRASGRVAVRFLAKDFTTGAVIAQCSKTFSWRALRDPGIVYGGKTSQDEPVVVELTQDRRRVSHAHLGWDAPCQTGGFLTVAHDEFDLQPFALSRTGAFSKTYRFSFGDGSTLVQRFAGKVGAKKTSGTYRADASLPTDTGSETCTSGAVSWRAATG